MASYKLNAKIEPNSDIQGLDSVLDAAYVDSGIPSAEGINYSQLAFNESVEIGVEVKVYLDVEKDSERPTAPTDDEVTYNGLINIIDGSLWKTDSDAKGTQETWSAEARFVKQTDGTYERFGNWQVVKCGAAGADGRNGQDGTTYEYIMCTTPSNPLELGTSLNSDGVVILEPNNAYDDSVSGSLRDNMHVDGDNNTDVLKDDYVPQGWTDDPIGIDKTNRYEYYCIRNLECVGTDANNMPLYKWGRFSTPVLRSVYGIDGVDGASVEYIYYLADLTNGSAENVAAPNSDYFTVAYNTDDYVPTTPSGWSDDPQSATADKPYVMMSKRSYPTKLSKLTDAEKEEYTSNGFTLDVANGTVTKDGKNVWSKFGAPVIWSNYSFNTSGVTVDSTNDNIIVLCDTDYSLYNDPSNGLPRTNRLYLSIGEQRENLVGGTLTIQLSTNGEYSVVPQSLTTANASEEDGKYTYTLTASDVDENDYVVLNIDGIKSDGVNYDKFDDLSNIVTFELTTKVENGTYHSGLSAFTITKQNYKLGSGNIYELDVDTDSVVIQDETDADGNLTGNKKRTPETIKVHIKHILQNSEELLAKGDIEANNISITAYKNDDSTTNLASELTTDEEGGCWTIPTDSFATFGDLINIKLYIDEDYSNEHEVIKLLAWGHDGEPGQDSDITEYIYMYTKDCDTDAELLRALKEQVDGDMTSINITDNSLTADYVPQYGDISGWSTDSVYGKYKQDITQWHDNPCGISSTWKYEWVSSRIYDQKEKTWGAFVKPTLRSAYGERGEDGDGVKYIFTKTADKITWTEENKPTFSTDWASTGVSLLTDTTGRTWYDDMQATDKTNVYQYVSMSTNKVNGNYVKDSWSKPTLWGTYVEPLYKLGITNDNQTILVNEEGTAWDSSVSHDISGEDITSKITLKYGNDDITEELSNLINSLITFSTETSSIEVTSGDYGLSITSNDELYKFILTYSASDDCYILKSTKVGRQNVLVTVKLTYKKNVLSDDITVTTAQGFTAANGVVEYFYLKTSSEYIPKNLNGVVKSYIQCNVVKYYNDNQTTKIPLTYLNWDSNGTIEDGTDDAFIDNDDDSSSTNTIWNIYVTKKNDYKIGDDVVYADCTKCNEGKITSEYLNTNVDEDAIYVLMVCEFDGTEDCLTIYDIEELQYTDVVSGENAYQLSLYANKYVVTCDKNGNAIPIADTTYNKIKLWVTSLDIDEDTIHWSCNKYINVDAAPVSIMSVTDGTTEVEIQENQMNGYNYFDITVTATTNSGETISDEVIIGKTNAGNDGVGAYKLDLKASSYVVSCDADGNALKDGENYSNIELTLLTAELQDNTITWSIKGYEDVDDITPSTITTIANGSKTATFAVNKINPYEYIYVTVTATTNTNNSISDYAKITKTLSGANGINAYKVEIGNLGLTFSKKVNATANIPLYVYYGTENITKDVNFKVKSFSGSGASLYKKQGGSTLTTNSEFVYSDADSVTTENASVFFSVNQSSASFDNGSIVFNAYKDSTKLGETTFSYSYVGNGLGIGNVISWYKAFNNANLSFAFNTTEVSNPSQTDNTTEPYGWSSKPSDFVLDSVNNQYLYTFDVYYDDDNNIMSVSPAHWITRYTRDGASSGKILAIKDYYACVSDGTNPKYDGVQDSLTNKYFAAYTFKGTDRPTTEYPDTMYISNLADFDIVSSTYNESATLADVLKWSSNENSLAPTQAYPFVMHMQVLIYENTGDNSSTYPFVGYVSGPYVSSQYGKTGTDAYTIDLTNQCASYVLGSTSLSNIKSNITAKLGTNNISVDTYANQSLGIRAFNGSGEDVTASLDSVSAKGKISQSDSIYTFLATEINGITDKVSSFELSIPIETEDIPWTKNMTCIVNDKDYEIKTNVDYITATFDDDNDTWTYSPNTITATINVDGESFIGDSGNKWKKESDSGVTLNFTINATYTFNNASQSGTYTNPSGISTSVSTISDNGNLPKTTKLYLEVKDGTKVLDYEDIPVVPSGKNGLSITGESAYSMFIYNPAECFSKSTDSSVEVPVVIYHGSDNITSSASFMISSFSENDGVTIKPTSSGATYNLTQGSYFTTATTTASTANASIYVFSNGSAASHNNGSIVIDGIVNSTTIGKVVFSYSFVGNGTGVKNVTSWFKSFENDSKTGQYEEIKTDGISPNRATPTTEPFNWSTSPTEINESNKYLYTFDVYHGDDNSIISVSPIHWVTKYTKDGVSSGSVIGIKDYYACVSDKTNPKYDADNDDSLSENKYFGAYYFTDGTITTSQYPSSFKCNSSSNLTINSATYNSSVSLNKKQIWTSLENSLAVDSTYKYIMHLQVIVYENKGDNSSTYPYLCQVSGPYCTSAAVSYVFDLVNQCATYTLGGALTSLTTKINAFVNNSKILVNNYTDKSLDITAYKNDGSIMDGITAEGSIINNTFTITSLSGVTKETAYMYVTIPITCEGISVEKQMTILVGEHDYELITNYDYIAATQESTGSSWIYDPSAITATVNIDNKPFTYNGSTWANNGTTHNLTFQYNYTVSGNTTTSANYSTSGISLTSIPSVGGTGQPDTGTTPILSKIYMKVTDTNGLGDYEEIPVTIGGRNGEPGNSASEYSIESSTDTIRKYWSYGQCFISPNVLTLTAKKMTDGVSTNITNSIYSKINDGDWTLVNSGSFTIPQTTVANALKSLSFSVYQNGSYQAVKNINVQADSLPSANENLLNNSNFSSNTVSDNVSYPTTWTYSAYSGSSLGHTVTANATKYEGTNIYELTYDSTNNNRTDLILTVSSISESDTYYTLSFYAKSSIANAQLGILIYNGVSVVNSYSWDGETYTTMSGDTSYTTIDTSWKRYTYIFKTNASASSSVNVVFRNFASIGSNSTLQPNFYIAKVKLEKCLTATAWCLSESDKKGKDGSNGSQGYPGCITRMFKNSLENGKEYRCDTKKDPSTLTDGVAYLDYFIKQTESGVTSAWVCTSTYTLSGTTTTPDETHWATVNISASGFFESLTAITAEIDMINSAGIVLHDEDNEIFAAFVNPTTTNTTTDPYVLWSNGKTGAEATFSVKRSGELYCSNGIFVGAESQKMVVVYASGTSKDKSGATMNKTGYDKYYAYQGIHPFALCGGCTKNVDSSYFDSQIHLNLIYNYDNLAETNYFGAITEKLPSTYYNEYAWSTITNNTSLLTENNKTWFLMSTSNVSVTSNYSDYLVSNVSVKCPKLFALNKKLTVTAYKPSTQLATTNITTSGATSNTSQSISFTNNGYITDYGLESIPTIVLPFGGYWAAYNSASFLKYFNEHLKVSALMMNGFSDNAFETNAEDATIDNTSYDIDYLMHFMPIITYILNQTTSSFYAKECYCTADNGSIARLDSNGLPVMNTHDYVWGYLELKSTLTTLIGNLYKFYGNMYRDSLNFIGKTKSFHFNSIDYRIIGVHLKQVTRSDDNNFNSLFIATDANNNYGYHGFASTICMYPLNTVNNDYDTPYAMNESFDDVDCNISIRDLIYNYYITNENLNELLDEMCPRIYKISYTADSVTYSFYGKDYDTTLHMYRRYLSANTAHSLTKDTYANFVAFIPNILDALIKKSNDITMKFVCKLLTLNVSRSSDDSDIDSYKHVYWEVDDVQLSFASVNSGYSEFIYPYYEEDTANEFNNLYVINSSPAAPTSAGSSSAPYEV